MKISDLSKVADADFECALKQALRIDPDIIVTGVGRDASLSSAIKDAASTGHKLVERFISG